MELMELMHGGIILVLLIKGYFTYQPAFAKCSDCSYPRISTLKSLETMFFYFKFWMLCACKNSTIGLLHLPCISNFLSKKELNKGTMVIIDGSG